jgi:hypothetical protein
MMDKKPVISTIADAIRNFENPKLSEEEFKQIWLPLFAGLSGPPPIERWLYVAGSPFMEVDVISSTGEKLFTVPPLLNNDPAVVERFKEISVSRAVEIIEVNYNYHPRVGEQKMESLLNQRVGKGNPKIDFAVRMNAILERYGLPKMELKGILSADPRNSQPATAVLQNQTFEDL